MIKYIKLVLPTLCVSFIPLISCGMSCGLLPHASHKHSDYRSSLSLLVPTKTC